MNSKDPFAHFFPFFSPESSQSDTVAAHLPTRKMSGFQFSQPPSARLLEVFHNVFPASPERSPVRYSSGNCFVLDYLCSGQVLTRVDGLALSRRENFTAHLYPPGTIYYEQHTQESKQDTFWIKFDGQIPFLKRLIDNSVHFASIKDPRQQLRKLLIDAAQIANSGSSMYWKSQQIFYEILSLLEQALPEENNQHSYCWTLAGPELNPTEPELSRQIQNFLEQHYREKLSLSRIAAALNISTSTLSHRYRQSKGKSVLQHLLEIRLQQSLPLLERGERLKTIAESCGFGNEFYYSRLFKKFYGLPPQLWRQKF